MVNNSRKKHTAHNGLGRMFGICLTVAILLITAMGSAALAAFSITFTNNEMPTTQDFLLARMAICMGFAVICLYSIVLFLRWWLDPSPKTVLECIHQDFGL